jgi:hypothetical protein
VTDLADGSWRVETWLLDDGKLRRARTNDELTFEEFEKRREPEVAYVVYRSQKGTYSNSRAGRPRWRRVKRLSWLKRYV